MKATVHLLLFGLLIFSQQPLRAASDAKSSTLHRLTLSVVTPNGEQILLTTLEGRLVYVETDISSVILALRAKVEDEDLEQVRVEVYEAPSQGPRMELWKVETLDLVPGLQTYTRKTAFTVYISLAVLERDQPSLAASRSSPCSSPDSALSSSSALPSSENLSPFFFPGLEECCVPCGADLGCSSCSVSCGTRSCCSGDCC